MIFGFTIIGLGALWAYVPERVEKVLGVEETEEQRRELKDLRRKVPRIIVVERDQGRASGDDERS